MPFPRWVGAEKALAAGTEKVTPEQIKLAGVAGISIPPATPRVVAASQLRVALAKQLGLPETKPSTGGQIERIKLLRAKKDPLISPANAEEAEAWITHLRLARRRENLDRLQLCAGDVVKTNDGEFAEVSSVGEEGRIYFKGGRGFGTWPDLVAVVARAGDTKLIANEYRKLAADAAARRASPAAWSAAKSADLAEYLIRDVATADDIDQLESIIAKAKDERPIQEFLNTHPCLLAELVGGRERYCLPHKRLGGEYVPDFIIGEVDSLGVRWTLVELETPMSGIYRKGGMLFDQYTQKGLSQTADWRKWLSGNITYARQPRSDDGLGLFDIREKTKAFVLVGRRSKIPKTKDALRGEYRQSNDIHIHSYDWLLEQLRGAIDHDSLPATN